MTIDKAKRILDAKADIRDAIIAMGVEVPEDTPFSAYPQLIRAIWSVPE